MAKSKGRGDQTGFTLIELMIVVVIVAVLATLAYPSYMGYTIKANRARAQAYLMHAAQLQREYFNNSRSYAADEATLNLTTPERVDKFYEIDFAPDPNTPPTFTLTATPRSGTPQVDDGILTIDNTGEKLRGLEPW